MKKSLIQLLKDLYNYTDEQALEVYQIFYANNNVCELLNFLLLQKERKEKKLIIEVLIYE